MKVKVRQEDIEQGTCGSARECAIALAVKRAAPWLRDVRILPAMGKRPAAVGHSSYGNLIDLPESCGTFIHNFDRGYRVQPFEFELEIPDEENRNRGGQENE